jgi:hypothetical protein
MGSTLNDREEKPTEDEPLVKPKRNLYVQFKAFPNLETLKTSTIWQEDENSAFNYRA